MKHYQSFHSVVFRTGPILTAGVACLVLIIGCIKAENDLTGMEKQSSGENTIGGHSSGLQKAYLAYLKTPEAHKNRMKRKQENHISCPLGDAPIRKNFLGKAAAVGATVGPHFGGLNKRDFTWSIKRNYTGYTPDAISDELIETYLQHVMSSWASVANLSFERVDSGGEITFEWQDSIPGFTNAEGICLSKDAYGTPHPYILGEAYGAQIIFAGWFHDGGNLIDVDWTDVNRALIFGLHEMGHFLGMVHAQSDQYYGNNLNPACSGCTCTDCNYPLENDESVMSYDVWPLTGDCAAYLSAYDINVIEQKYGPNAYGVPFLELWIPGWGRNIYLNSWQEANPLVRSGFAQDVNWFVGMLKRDSTTYHTPLHRHFTNEVGVGNKEYYSVGSRLYSPTPMTYLGVSGYVMTAQGWGTQALYRHYKSSSQDHRYTMTSTPPSGYSSQGAIGYIIPYDILWPSD
jgi:hypothetical protein